MSDKESEEIICSLRDKLAQHERKERILTAKEATWKGLSLALAGLLATALFGGGVLWAGYISQSL